MNSQELPVEQPQSEQPTPQTPPVVQVVRPSVPEKPVVSPRALQLHERSKRLFPTLNLSEGEFVISAVRRHPIGLVIPLTVGTLLIAAALALLFNYAEFVQALTIQGPLADASAVTVPILLLVVLIALFMFVSYWVYTQNKFFLTNESVIQEIQTSLFARHEQTVSLANIEDASFVQKNIMQQLFNYGDIRLSTEGDETTYHFTYVARPKAHIERLNNAVEAFKNGRPVSED